MHEREEGALIQPKEVSPEPQNRQILNPENTSRAILGQSP